MLLFRKCGCVSEGESEVEIAFREAFANAIIHGNHAYGFRQYSVVPNPSTPTKVQPKYPFAAWVKCGSQQANRDLIFRLARYWPGFGADVQKTRRVPHRTFGETEPGGHDVELHQIPEPWCDGLQLKRARMTLGGCGTQNAANPREEAKPVRDRY
jgi:hypothetical protein